MVRHRGRGYPAPYLAHFDAPRRWGSAARGRRAQLGPGWRLPRFGARAWAARYLPTRSLRGRRQIPRARRTSVAAPLSRVAGLRVPSPTTRRPSHTFPNLGLPDRGRVALQVYRIAVISPDGFLIPLEKFGELLITAILYASYVLEPAFPATYPESGLSRKVQNEASFSLAWFGAGGKRCSGRGCETRLGSEFCS